MTDVDYSLSKPKGKLTILQGEEAINLWLKGQDEWNDWVEANPEAEVSFFEVDFTKYVLNSMGNCISFEGFNFPSGTTTFRLAKFGSYQINFVNANFGDGLTLFSDIDFGEGNISFYEAQFGDGDISFKNRKLLNGDLDFENTDFSDGLIEFNNFNLENGNIIFIESNFGKGKIFSHHLISIIQVLPLIIQILIVEILTLIKY
ncbi:hypothetical protein [Photobacterium kasasachensis]|uniref:hypothetical protein n=1 Tax=Photobacterium kasasachensis TaxID=2910240 RepID=UPI003D1224A2